MIIRYLKLLLIIPIAALRYIFLKASGRFVYLTPVLISFVIWIIYENTPADKTLVYEGPLFYHVVNILIIIITPILLHSKKEIKLENKSIVPKDIYDKGFLELNIITMVLIAIMLMYDLGHYSHIEKWRFQYLGHDHFDEGTSWVSSSLSGILAPTATLIGGYLTYNVFRMQQKQNIINRFYEALKFHRDNVKDMKKKRFNNDKFEGRRLFLEFYKELKLIYQINAEYLNTSEVKKKLLENKIVISEWEKTNIAYLIFFFGIDSENEIGILYEDGLEHKIYGNIVSELINNLRKRRGDSQTLNAGKIFTPSPGKYNGVPTGLQLAEDSMCFDFENYAPIFFHYTPFAGHQSRLGHYFRHLFGIASMLMNEPELSDAYFPEKLRGQLSNYEQVLLYYFAVSILGNRWFSQNYIVKLNIIKDTPLPMIRQFGLQYDDAIKILGNPETRNQEFQFEWDRIKERIKQVREKISDLD